MVAQRGRQKVEIRPFALERYFGKFEFTAKVLLSSSDCESLSQEELVDRAGPEADRLWRELRLGYTEGAGHPLLRAEIAGLYREIRPSGVMVAAPEEAIFVAMHALLAAGDHVVAVAPAYQSLHELPRAIGCTVTPWTLRLGDGGWRIDLDELESAITEHTRMLVINFPHNPTGHQIGRAELDRIVEVARKHSLWLLSDEMYRLLELDEADRLPAVCDLYERGISLSGLSKAFGLPGLRIGWLATRETGLVERWLTVKDYTTICSSAPSEVLAIIALQAKDWLLERAAKIVRGNLMAARIFFGEHAAALAWVDPRAGSVAFPRWLGESPIEQLCEEARATKGLMIVPGSLFDYPGNHFRVGLGRKNLPAALALLGDVLRERSGPAGHA
jgi:aspartate/methionine/tyrosine aminotransferase